VHLDEGFGDEMKMLLNRHLMIRGRRFLYSLEFAIEFIALIRTNGLHVGVLEHPHKVITIFDALPAEDRLGN
jgi:hypothetical protein